VKIDPLKAVSVLEGHCSHSALCPLSRIQAGVTVCIRQLATGPELTLRLRELGLFEDQKVKVLSNQSSFICQVCNARLGISQKLASAILVEALPEKADARHT
jgi:Fe2+ transport system protein FeoA